ncbi:mucin-5B-like protein, partial [Dinothrombium tinctorium]
MIAKLFIVLSLLAKFAFNQNLDIESNAIVSNCETIPIEIRVTKEEMDENGNAVRVCEGDVVVNKCEGLCSSKIHPSVAKPSGFMKECVCCRESWMDKKDVQLTECFDPDGKRLTGALSTMLVSMEEPKSCACNKCAYSNIATEPLSPHFDLVKASVELSNKIMYLKMFTAFLILMFVCGHSYGNKEICHLRPVIHLLKHPGCMPKPIPSFACQGSCSSYVQVSGSKFWQVERSCMCCQEMGEREATVSVFCPQAVPKFRKIVTRAPVNCMCRPCTDIDEKAIKPQELLNLITNGVEESNLPPV